MKRALAVLLFVLSACSSEAPVTLDAAPLARPEPAPEVVAPAAAVVVELTHDVICPWCRIGHTRLQKALALYGKPVTIVYRPFLLEPDMPPEGADMRERLAAKYGADRIESMFQRVTQIGAQDGIVFAFDKVTRTPSSIAAHVLIEAAPADKQSALLDQFHHAYFERGEDLGDATVLTRLWVAAGLPAEAAKTALADASLAARIRNDAAAASQSGIRGVPNFKIGSATLNGAQPVEAIVAALRQAER